MSFSGFLTIFVNDMMLDRILLFPYYLSLKVRNNYYDKGGKRVHTADVPTLCVGNITAGGTGKTPHVEMILRMLLDSNEWGSKNLAVLSRGYMRESKGFQQVMTDGAATSFGDEPLQIKKKFPGVTVAVDKDRFEGCTLLAHPDKLEARKYEKRVWNRSLPAADYIILDDAFQYRKLKATKNVVLVDYNHPVMSDSLLPIGRLRDLKERLGDADVIIVTKCPEEMDTSEKTAFAHEMGVLNFETSTCEGTTAAGRTQMVFFSKISYCQPRVLFEDADPRFIYSKKIITMTGIAKDKPLRNYLSDTYKIVRRFNFPDHHKYTWSDINKVQAALRQNPTAAIATTEKDAQRLLDFGGMPKAMSERMFVVPIEVKFLSENEESLFRNYITTV